MARQAGDWRVIVLTTIAPLLILSILCALHVPLGKPATLTYLYSPIPLRRIGSALALLPIAALAGYAVVLCDGLTRGRRRLGLALAALSLIGVGTWSYFAPPEHVNQHVFNMQSPSHDGAFVYEAFQFDDCRGYLRDFPQRAATPPAEMKGTRVISNPPGTTLLAYGVRRALGDAALDILDVPEGAAELRFFRLRAGVGLVTLWIFTGLWIASAAVIYGTGRLYFAEAPSAALAILSVVTPMTLLFAPGKDVAQLFTLSVPLYLWLMAWRTGRRWAAAAAGLCLAAAILVSLVHAWLAAIVVAACVVAELRGGQLGRRLMLLLIAGAGAMVGWGALWVIGVDVPSTLRAVARAQAEVTRGASAMPLMWQLLGVPIFVLFCGPAVVLALAGAFRPGAAAVGGRFARALSVGALVVMLATIGFTNMETPRLWIAFVPLLLLAAFLRTDESMASRPSQGSLGHATRRARWLGMLVAGQIAAGGLQWSLMDMRETETRLIGETPRFFK
ncbi:hypothetical protein RAS1_41520 [Phycisphaerae bacterium RAS1]|nr:hypothetical protein RAS1_41520 [Phycisphaerae bacterium RAS1]